MPVPRFLQYCLDIQCEPAPPPPPRPAPVNQGGGGPEYEVYEPALRTTVDDEPPAVESALVQQAIVDALAVNPTAKAKRQKLTRAGDPAASVTVNQIVYSLSINVPPRTRRLVDRFIREAAAKGVFIGKTATFRPAEMPGAGAAPQLPAHGADAPRPQPPADTGRIVLDVEADAGPRTRGVLPALAKALGLTMLPQDGAPGRYRFLVPDAVGAETPPPAAAAPESWAQVHVPVIVGKGAVGLSAALLAGSAFGPLGGLLAGVLAAWWLPVRPAAPVRRLPAPAKTKEKKRKRRRARRLPA